MAHYGRERIEFDFGHVLMPVLLTTISRLQPSVFKENFNGSGKSG